MPQGRMNLKGLLQMMRTAMVTTTTTMTKQRKKAKKLDGKMYKEKLRKER